MEEDRNLSASEALIMKAIWEAGGVVPFLELMELLRTKYGKDYSRNSVATFLLRMADKGFVESKRKGKNAYIYALKSRDDYAYQQLKHDIDMWFSGKAVNAVTVMLRRKDITRKDIAEIRKLLDELDSGEPDIK